VNLVALWGHDANIFGTSPEVICVLLSGSRLLCY